MRTYRHSGIVPPLGAIQALAIGAAAAVVLGIVYSFSFYYIPYVYLNFLLAIGFGVGVGGAVGWAAREGKIRNTGVTVSVAVLATLAGIYAEWGSTIYAMAPLTEIGNVWKEVGLASFLPHNIIGLMLQLFEEGSWGLTAGQMVNGWTLFGLWWIEAGVIIGFAGTTAYAQIAKRPFCEPCGEWITGESPHLYTGDGSEQVWLQIQHGEFDALADTSQATGGEPTYVRLTLHACETCSESNYLTITTCQNTTDAKGNPKLIASDLVTNLAVISTHVDLIRAAHLIAPPAGMLPMPLDAPAIDALTGAANPSAAGTSPIPAGPVAAGSAPSWAQQS